MNKSCTSWQIQAHVDSIICTKFDLKSTDDKYIYFITKLSSHITDTHWY